MCEIGVCVCTGTTVSGCILFYKSVLGFFNINVVLSCELTFGFNLVQAATTLWVPQCPTCKISAACESATANPSAETPAHSHAELHGQATESTGQPI